MRGQDLITALKRKTGVSTDAALCRQLGVTNVTLTNWRNTRAITARTVASQIGRLLAYQPRGDKIVHQLEKQFSAKSLTDLRRKIGVTNATIHWWKGLRALTARQIAGIVHKAADTATTRTHATAIRPLVEFFEIDRCESVQGAKFELFATKNHQGKVHRYLAGLKAELKQHHGVYIFFDSRGQAIYAGKARLQNLWSEMTDAFNRNRGSVQKIKRVRHPTRNQQYRNTNEKSRQIRDVEVPLHELAAYFSSYEVADPLIEDIESLLVRSFANDLLNIRMEQFGLHRRSKAKKQRKRRRKTSRRKKSKRKKRR